MKRIDEKRNLRGVSRGTRRRVGAWLSAILMLFSVLQMDMVGLAEGQEVVAATYCGLEEHSHTASCYDGDGALICGLEAHAHAPECYVEPDEEPAVVEVKADPVEPEKPAVELNLVEEKEPDAVPTLEPGEEQYLGETVEEVLTEIEEAVEAAPAPENVLEADVLPAPDERLEGDVLPGADVLPEKAEAAEETEIDEIDETIPGELPEDPVYVPETEETLGDDDAEIENPEEEIIVEENAEEETNEEKIEETVEDENTEETVEAPADAEDETTEDESAEGKDAAEAPADDEAAEASEGEDAEEAVADEDETTEEETTEEEIADEETIEDETADEEAVEDETAEEDAEEPEIAYPAQRFEEKAFNVAVTAQAPEGAFPEGTDMRINRVWDNDTLSDIRDTVEEDFVEVKRVTAVDIAFYNAEGVEIEPLLPIEVSIAVADIRDDQSAVVVHVDDDGNAELVEQAEAAATADTMELTVEMPATELNFEADAFSIYAVVVTETIETRYIADGGETYRITLGYGPEANIPAGAALEVRELAAEDYIDQAEAALPEDERIALARFFDIAIIADGVEIEPAAPVQVQIALDEYAEGDVRAVHFEDGGDVTLIDAEQASEGVVFSADSFSTYGLVYTLKIGDKIVAVDGTKKTIQLSELLSKLGSEIKATDVTAVSFDKEDMEAVRKSDGSDWTLTVVKPFETALTMTLTVNGKDEIITIESAIREWNITNLLKKVQIYEGDKKIGSSDDDSVTLNPGKSYTVKFSFAESMSHQFSDNSIVMYYDVPAQVRLDDRFSETDQTLSIALDDGLSLDGNKVWYDKTNRRICVQWNTEGSNFEMLTDAANAEFTLEYMAYIEVSEDGIPFSDTVKVVVEPDKRYNAEVDKTGEYNAVTDTVDYTVTVTADAAAEDLVVKDAITGTALSLLPKSLKVYFGADADSKKEQTSGDTYTYIPNAENDGFTLKIDKLPDGQKAFITYSAAVNYSNLTGMGDAEQTQNTVSLDGPENKPSKDFDMAGKIKYIDLDKEIGDKVTDNDGNIIIPWKITYNTNTKVSVAGATITDRITSGAVDAMEYIADDPARPFVVVAHDKSGNTREIVNLADWTDMVTGFNYTYDKGNVSVSGQSWKWQVPTEENYSGLGEGPYWYTITYYTKVNPNHILMQNATITNTVTEDKTGNEAAGKYEHGNSEPDPKTQLAVEKKAIEVSENWTKWQVSFPRWSFALVPAYLIDTHPRTSAGDYAESVITDAEKAAALGIEVTDAVPFKVDGLKTLDNYTDAQGVVHGSVKEHVEVTYTDDAKTVFRFMLVDAASESTPVNINANGTGLLARTDENDKITITYYTQNSYTVENGKSWVDHAMDGEAGYPIEHTNQVELIANGQSVKDDDTVTLKKPGFAKSADLDSSGLIKPVATLATDDKLLPVYKFTLTFKGIDDHVRKENESPIYYTNNWFNEAGNIVVTDTYGDNLRLLTEAEVKAAFNLQDAYQYALKPGDDNYAAVPVSASENEGKTEATFTIGKESFKSGERYAYAPVYTLDYYLTLDMTDDAVKAVLEDSNSGMKTGLSNTASVPEKGNSKVDFKADLKPLDKSVSEIAGNSEKFRYKIVINPLGLMLNNGYTYRLTDTFYNLSVDFSTMKITPQDGVSWIYTGNEGTFWIPDGKAVIIEYDAWPVGKRGQEITMENTAEMMGYSSTQEKKVSLASSGSGSASVYRLQLLKYGDNDMSMSNRLEDVKFQLYQLNSAGELELMTYPEIPKLDSSGDQVFENGVAQYWHREGDAVEFTTDKNGMATIKLSMMKDGMVLQSGKQYYLREVESSVPAGYMMEDIYWSFVLSDVSNYTAYVYRTNDVLKVSNQSTNPALILRKEFDTTDGAVEPPYSETKNIQFEIEGFDASNKKVFDRIVKYSDFKWYAPNSASDSDGKVAAGDGYYCYRLLWTDEAFEGKNITRFTITELTDTAKIDRYSLVTKVDNGSYGAVGETAEATFTLGDTAVSKEVLFTNRYTPVPPSLAVTKNVTGLDDAGRSFAFTVTMGDKYLAEDGKLTDAVKEYTIKPGETKLFSNIQEVGNYTVTEILRADDNPSVSITAKVTPAGSDESADGIVSTDSSKPNTATVIVKSGKNTDVTITNAYTNVTDFTFGKLWRGPTTASTLVWPVGATIRVTIGRYAENKDNKDNTFKLVYQITRPSEKKSLTATYVDGTYNTGTAPTLNILDEGDWYRYQFKLSGLPAKDANGNKWNYYAVESQPMDGYDTHYGIVDGFSAVYNDKDWSDAHMGYDTGTNKTIIGNIINTLEGYKIDVPVKKGITGSDIFGNARTPKEDEKYQFQLTYTDYNGDEETAITTTTGENVAWFKDIPVKLTRASTKSVKNQYCIEAVLTYKIKELGSVTPQYSLGMTNFDKEVTVTEVIDIGWESREIVERERTITYDDNVKEANAKIKNMDVTVGEEKVKDVQVVEIINKYEEEKWNLWIRKSWDDAQNQDGKRRNLTFTVKFYATDAQGAYTELASKEYGVNLGNGVKDAEVYNYISVPRFINGVLITKYELSEAELKEGDTVIYSHGTLSPDTFTVTSYDKDVKDLNAKDTNPAQVTNTHTPEQVNVKITKNWDDNGNTDRRTPVTMTLRVSYDGASGKVDKTFNEIKTNADWQNYAAKYGVSYGNGEVTLSAANGWNHTWNNLPKYAPGEVGKLVTYTVVEDTSNLKLGYYQSSSTTSGYDNTITNKLSLVDITATKAWEDDDNRDGLRGSVTLELSATVNGNSVLADIRSAGYDVTDRTISLNSGSSTVKWEKLPEYDTNKNKITYAVTEKAPVPTGYTAEVTNTGYAFTVTNRHTYIKTRIDFTKTWAGDGDDLHARPSIEAYLDQLELRMNGVLLTKGAVKDGKQYLTTTETVTASDQAAIEAAWVELSQSDGTYSVRWVNLPKRSNGQKITYTLKEKAIAGYTAASATGDVTLSEAGNGNYTGALTNTRKTFDLKISKALVSDLKADKQEVFSFKIETKPAIGGTYSGIKFTSGESETITLKGGGVRILKGLPTLVKYTVTETEDAEDRFTVKANGADGNIAVLDAQDSDADKTLEAVFTNTRKIADLVVSKTVESALDFDKTHVFQFRVTLDDDSISGEYGDMTFDKGMATLTLSDGKSATAVGLPTDLGYKVEELVDDEDYFSYFAEVQPISGTIKTGDNSAAFTNTRVYAPVQLMKVDATKADNPLAEAEFTLAWADGSLELISDESGALLAQKSVSSDTIVATNGKALMKLANGTYTLTETRAPGGYKKLVGEVKLTVKDFAVTVDIDAGTNEGVEASVSALKSEADVIIATLPNIPGAGLPESGGQGTTAYYVGGTGLMLLALFMLLKKRRAN